MIIGLTGGIASGKSTVARLFGDHGARWVDADDIAREVVAPGEPALKAIVDRYGDAILTREGRLDRAALRALVFADEKERRWLEATTHPRVRERLVTRLSLLRQQDAPYVLLVSPLLFESGQVDMVQRTLVVDVPEALQIERTTQRDDVDLAQAKAIVASQMGRDERVSLADDVITNDGDLAALSEAVKALDATYRRLAAKA
ncbi:MULTISPECIES: dephospho-CoA kinase [Halomonas]|mgnify:CR=1 FL=1|uniref:Dephospho-CoA kinase n=2 Tax=Halomonas TaxID=2745 RepID=A0AAU7KM74_9GAMM|nr:MULTISPECIES: dephospho-CoA kinase [Halomonas]MBR9769765.1 dephospho-CoA kinase [Gammaproteobacteria bacterium]KJZ16551.1 dephospho-CoA kinase [Halomonas sp. S2151]MCJ8285876.1 dephospho-CoA kinase [Halomonas sp.]MCO7215523.1 dephospho-CoA kinase [Halomonas sp. OfavH-34-E]NQY70930.1 dephospho-CoA kinase [Halomonas sp.]